MGVIIQSKFAMRLASVQPAWRVRDHREAAPRSGPGRADRRPVFGGRSSMQLKQFMRKINFIFTAALFAALSCGTTTVRLEAQPTKSTYQIISGTYSVFGGLVGSIVYPLPRDEQAFIVLTLDSDAGSARMEILRRDSSSSFLALTNGVVTGNEIRFHYTGATTSGVPATVSYCCEA